MREEFLAHVGGRMRLYRRGRGMSLAELGQKVGKSKASLSKYESGQVALDILTLYEIAGALGITPAALLDYESKQGPPITTGGRARNAFVAQSHLYVYHMHRRQIFFSQLKLGLADEEGRMEATLFYKADSPDRVEQCDCIYRGVLQGHDTVISLQLTNYHNPVETILLNFSIPMRKADSLIGMMSGLDVNTYLPVAYRALLSKAPIDDKEMLTEALTIPPELYRDMRHNNNLQP
jgi:transcriptional regulator with XRE-family HTH domain